jgi:hypothetical protein
LTVTAISGNISLSNLTQVYTGSQLSPTVTTTPNNLSYTWIGAPQTNAGSYNVTATITDPNYAGSASGSFVITPATLTASITAADKVYDGTTAATITSCTLQGVAAVDAGKVTCTASGVFSSATVGTWTVTATSVILNGSAGNYQLSAAMPTTTAKITPRAASVTPNAASKIYGAPDPALTGSLTGFVAGDGITATYSRTAGETVGGGPYTISATLSPAGVLANYTITSNTAAFTITAKAASVTPNAAGKIYGASDPALSGSLTGFVAGDGVTATFSRTAGETVAGGPYTISAMLSPAGVLANYTITSNTAAFTITAKAASVTPDAKSKAYGADDPALTGTLSGFLATDSVIPTYSRTPGETAGSYTISAALNPAGVLANYTITYNTAAFTINKLAASVTPNAASKIYGAADPTLTGTLTGFLPADIVTATYSRTPGTDVGSYTISAVLSPGSVLGNYTITYNTANFTITQAGQAILFVLTGNKPLGTDFSVSATATSGLPVSFSASGSCTVSGTTVHPTAAGPCSITASQTGNLNYVAATPVMQTVSITKLSQTITFTSFKITATATSGLAVTFSTDSPNTVCTVLPDGTVTIPAGGSWGNCHVLANQDGNGSNYDAAATRNTTLVHGTIDQSTGVVIPEL